MKKTIKKLVLTKETVRDLEAPKLRRAAGGFTEFPCAEEYTGECPSERIPCPITP